MIPEVEAYFFAMQNTDEYDRAVNQAETDNPLPRWSVTLTDAKRAEYYAAEGKRQDAMRKADHDWKERQGQALDALKNSNDPLVRWIAQHVGVRGDYRRYVDYVLRALPMTREELEEFGEQQGLGSGYRLLVEAAGQAGVLPEPTPELADIQPLVDEFTRLHGHWHGKTLRTMIRKHLPTILESARQREQERTGTAVSAA